MTLKSFYPNWLIASEIIFGIRMAFKFLGRFGSGSSQSDQFKIELNGWHKKLIEQHVDLSKPSFLPYD